jgi:hypothetical protein
MFNFRGCCMVFRLTIGNLKHKPLQWCLREKTTAVPQKVTPYRKGYAYIYLSAILFETAMSIYQFSISPLYVQSSVL